jgi:hypothetical protein
MEFGRIYFQFNGFFSENLDFIDANNERQLMQRYDYFGGSICISVDQSEVDRSPREGSGVFIQGILRVDKKQKITLNPEIILAEGRDANYKQANQDLLIKGAIFSGDTIISDKRCTTVNGDFYRSFTIPIFGGCYKFSNLTEQIYAIVPDKGFVRISGIVQSRVSSGKESKQVVTSLSLESVEPIKFSTGAEKPSKAA